jgi:hypothetical protein
VAYITPRAVWEGPFGAEARDAARRAGLSLLGIPLESPIQEAEYRRAFAAAAAGDVAGLIIPDIEEHARIGGLSSSWPRKLECPRYTRIAILLCSAVSCPMELIYRT